MSDINDMVRRAATQYMAEDLDRLDEFTTKAEEAAWEIGVEAKEFWSSEAARHLNTTRLRYQNALEVYEDFSEGVTVQLNPDDSFVTEIEEGTPGYDMKPALLGGEIRRVIPIGPTGEMRVVSRDQGSEVWMKKAHPGLKLEEVVDAHTENAIIPTHLNRLFEEL